MTYLAIDIGGSHASCALTDGSALVSKRAFAIGDNRSLRGIIPCLETAIEELRRQAAVKPEGIALSFCGLVDSAKGRIIQSNGRYFDAADIDFAEWARTRFELPLRMDNDARMALLGERAAGAAHGSADVVMVILGTGVGGAALINGRLLRGKHFQAGCLLGHFGCELAGRACSCGNVGCIEAEASTFSLDKICREQEEYANSALANVEHITYKDVFTLAARGDPCARSVRARSVAVWSAAAVSWIHAYDPEVMVFGGGVMEAADFILPAIEEYVSRHAWTPWGKVAVRRAELGTDASLYAGPPLFAQAV